MKALSGGEMSLQYHEQLKSRVTSRVRYLLAGMLVSLMASPLQAMEVDELIKHIDHLWRGETSQASMSMTVKTRRYERTMTMEAWSRGKDY